MKPRIFLGALSATLLTGALAAGAPPKKLLDDPSLSYLENATTETAAGSGRGTIDVDLVATIIQERAGVAALRATRRALEAAKAGEFWTATEDLLTDAIALLNSRGGMDRAHLEALVKTGIRALVSELIARGWFHSDTAMRDLATQLGVQLKNDQLGRARSYIIDSTYRELRRLPWLSTGRKHTYGTACDKEFEALCKALAKHYDDGSLAKLLHIEDSINGLRIISAFATSKNAPPEIAQLLRSLKATSEIGDFSTGPLALAGWETSLSAVITAASNADATTRALRMAFVRARNESSAAKIAPEAAALAAAVKSPALAEVKKLITARFGKDDADATERDLNEWVAALSVVDPSHDHLPPPPPLLGSRLEPALDLVGELRKSEAGSDPIPHIRNATRSLERLLDQVDPTQRALDKLPMANVRELLGHLADASTAFEGIARFVQQWNLSVRLPPDPAKQLSLVARAIKRAETLAKLLDKIAVDVGLDLGVVGSVLQLLQHVPVELYEAIAPIVSEVATKKTLSGDAVLRAVAQVDMNTLAKGFGIETTDVESVCTDAGAKTAQCWVLTLLNVLKASISQDGSVNKVDTDKLAHALVKVGDDFRRAHEGRAFFHLTIGMGFLYSKPPPNFATVPNSNEVIVTAPRTVPLVAEQIGGGYAFPSWCDGDVTLKVGLFGSGLLYRAVIDSAESDAVMFGGLVAVDLFETIELYAAPTALFYAPIQGQNIDPRAGVSFGVQVPLGDYLSKVVSK